MRMRPNLNLLEKDSLPHGNDISFSFVDRSVSRFDLVEPKKKCRQYSHSASTCSEKNVWKLDPKGRVSKIPKQSEPKRNFSDLFVIIQVFELLSSPPEINPFTAHAG